MKKYERPVVVVNEELAEGVYLNSGDCYTFWGEITQGPDIPNKYHSSYVIQINGRHEATHHSGLRKVKVVFNKNVYYESSGADSYTGDGTSTLELTYVQQNGDYHSEKSDNIGLGNLYLSCEGGTGLAIISTTCTYCNEECFTPDH